MIPGDVRIADFFFFLSLLVLILFVTGEDYSIHFSCRNAEHREVIGARRLFHSDPRLSWFHQIPDLFTYLFGLSSFF